MAEECARKSIKKRLLLREKYPSCSDHLFYPTCPCVYYSVYILMYLNKSNTGFGGTPPLEINHALSYVPIPRYNNINVIIDMAARTAVAENYLSKSSSE